MKKQMRIRVIHPYLRRHLSWAKHGLLYQTTGLGRESRARLEQLKDSRRGERCFILGNGPSLRRTDLTRLKGESTFGLNCIYLLFPELGFATTYLVTVNWLVLEQCAAEILAAPGTKFIPWSFRNHINPALRQEPVFLMDLCRKAKFHTEITRSFWNSPTVTVAALQIAYHMGYEQVILVGVDHSFATPGPANQEVVSSGADPNHFSPDYFGRGFRWNLPDLENSERAYRMALQAFERDGRRVLDATVNGKLTVFPKVEYPTLFK